MQGCCAAFGATGEGEDGRLQPASTQEKQNADLKAGATKGRARQGGTARKDMGTEQEPRTPKARVLATRKKLEMTPARWAANRANLEKARAAIQAKGMVMTERRRAANRENLILARAALQEKMSGLSPEARKIAHHTRTQPAREELRRNGQNLRDGLNCPSLMGSLRAAGEKGSELAAHGERFDDAFKPRDAYEQGIVTLLAEAVWQRLRGLRLAARWEARKLAARLAPWAGKVGVPFNARQAARQRAADQETSSAPWRVVGVMIDILEIFLRIGKLVHRMKRVNRRIQGLVQAFMDARAGEHLEMVEGFSAGRVQLFIAPPRERAARERAPSRTPFRPPNLLVRGMGKASSVQCEDSLEDLLMAACGARSDAEQLQVLKLAEAVWQRVMMLEDQAKREEAELTEILNGWYAAPVAGESPEEAQGRRTLRAMMGLADLVEYDRVLLNAHFRWQEEIKAEFVKLLQMRFGQQWTWSRITGTSGEEWKEVWGEGSEEEEDWRFEIGDAPHLAMRAAKRIRRFFASLRMTGGTGGVGRRRKCGGPSSCSG